MGITFQQNFVWEMAEHLKALDTKPDLSFIKRTKTLKFYFEHHTCATTHIQHI